MAKKQERAEYVELRAKLRKIRDEAEAAAREGFKVGIAQIFEEHPIIEEINWTQYTPYFNDGDTCEFGVNEPDVIFVDEDADEIDDRYEHLERDLKNKQEEAAFAAVKEFLSVFEDEDLETIYGDHAIVRITREGTKVEGYDHD